MSIQLSNNTLLRAYDKASIEQKRNQSRPVWLIKIIDIFARLLSFLMNHSSYDRRSFIKESIRHILSLFKEQKIQINDIKNTIDIVNKFKNVATNAQLNDLDKLKKKFDEIKNQPQKKSKPDENNPIELEDVYGKSQESHISAKNPMYHSNDGKKGEAHEDDAQRKRQSAVQNPLTRIDETLTKNQTIQEIDAVDFEDFEEIPREKKEITLDSVITLKYMPKILLQNLENKTEINFTYRSLLELIKGNGNTFEITNTNDQKLFSTLLPKLGEFQKTDQYKQLFTAIEVFDDIMTHQPVNMSPNVLQEKLRIIKQNNQKLYEFFFEPVDSGESYLESNPLIFLLFKRIKATVKKYDYFSQNDQTRTTLIFWFSAMEQLAGTPKESILNEIENGTSLNSFLAVLLLNENKKVFTKKFIESGVNLSNNTKSTATDGISSAFETFESNKERRNYVFKSIKNMPSAISAIDSFIMNIRTSIEAKAPTREANTPTKVAPGYPPSMRVADKAKGHGKYRYESENIIPNTHPNPTGLPGASFWLKQPSNYEEINDENLTIA